MRPRIEVECLVGQSAHRPVLLGFAAAELLYRLSFADVLDEESGQGYQRPFNEKHSQDFRRYIKAPGSSTIPLTLNLRKPARGRWRIVSHNDSRARLEVAPEAGEVMAQVDCQHRLGYLVDLPVHLPFMCFIGLTEREEMEVFSRINGKAKGLSPSLLDYHAAELAHSLAQERPELYIALQLNRSDQSPWFRRLNLGGNATPGLRRIVSLRMMQKAIRDFLSATDLLATKSADEVVNILLDFWSAVVALLPDEWAAPRNHLLTKGVGVHTLMKIGADIVAECQDAGRRCDRRAFIAALGDFIQAVDWSTAGDLRGYGGQGGVKAAVEHLREKRSQTRYGMTNG